MEPILQVKDLNYVYSAGTPFEHRALENVNFTLNRGEFVGVIGHTGSGKSTLMQQLNGLLKPTSGQVLLDGVDIWTDKKTTRQARFRVGLVFQYPEYQLFEETVYKDIAFGPQNMGLSQEEVQRRVLEAAGFVGITQRQLQASPFDLSGGQKRRVAIAGVIAMEPEVLILDEPTSQLDPIAASDFLNTLKKINRELGTTILITEHRMEDVFPVADRVVVMEQGRVTAAGEPREVARQLYEEDSPLFSALPAPVRIFFAGRRSGAVPLTVREGRQWLHARFREPPRLVSLPPQPEFPAGKVPALEIREGWYRYERGGPDVLRGIGVSVPQGSFFTIVGGNGTGKSTTLKAICGICKLYRGSVRLFGKDLKSYRDKLFEGNLAMLPQDPKSLFVKQTLREDLAEMGSGKTSEIARLCQVEHLLDAHPSDLSGGETQRAALAKVLLSEPKLLLLDEPTKGLDSFFKQSFAALLKNLCRKGMTVVMVSHDIEFCAEHADLVGMFFDGQLLTTDTPRRFFGSNSFYTTAANRMSRGIFQNAVTAADVVALLEGNREAGL